MNPKKIALAMSLALFSSVTLFSPATTSATGVYRWVDENGEVHFSDKEVVPNARQIKIKPAPTPKNQAKNRSSSNVPGTEDFDPEYGDYGDEDGDYGDEDEEAMKQANSLPET